MKASKHIIAFFLAFAILCSSTIPAFAAGNVTDSPSVLLDFYNELTYDYFDSFGVGGLYQTFVDWCWGSTGSPTPQYEIGGGAGRVTSSGAQTETVYNSATTTNNYQAINTDNSTWYNPVINEYNTYNSITYNNEYEVYNIVNNEYNTYVTNNYTYVSYYIIDNETESTWYYEIYYQLPDGRNTWNMTRDEVWGLGLSYDAVNYDVVAEDDGTLGLWHFDSSLWDESVNGNNLNWAVWSDVSYTFVDSPYTSSFYMDDDLSHILYLPVLSSALNAWTLEGRVKFNVGQYITPDAQELEQTFTSVSNTPSWTNPFTGTTTSSPPNVFRFDGDLITDYVYTESVKGVGIGSLLNVGSGGTSRYFLPITADVTCTIRYNERQRSVPETGGVEYVQEVTVIPSFSNFRCCGIPIDTYFSFAIVNNGSTCKTYINGTAYDSSVSIPYSESLIYNNLKHYPSEADRTSDGQTITMNSNVVVAWDELRLSDRALYSSSYIPSTQPFDTNKVYVLPETGQENQIAVKSSHRVSLMRVGGVRPTYPLTGYLYVYVENGVVLDVQQYQTDRWVSVDAAMYRNGQWVNLKGLDISDIVISEPEEDSGGEATPTPTPEVTPTPTPSPTPAPSGGDSQTTKGIWDVIDTLLGGVLELFSTILGFLLNVVFSLFGWVVQLLGFINTSYLGGFFPAPVWGLVCIAVPLVVVLALVRFLRGFF